MTSLFKAVFVQPMQNMLRKFGLKITRLAHSPNVEDLIFQTLGNAQEVRFIQVGAHDGTHNDPISLFRNKPNWHGLLLEPNPRVYARLVKTLASSPQCQALNFALSEAGGTLPFYRVRNPETCRGGHFADQVSSFDRAHVEKMVIWFGYSKAEAGDWIEEVQVNTITFAELLDRMPNQSLELLFIDAEGADFRLLKTFPFERLRPRMLVFEFAHLSPDEMGQILPFLSTNGYAFSTVGEDVVAVAWPP
jgi:FkbM family methyltransferase